MVRKKQVDCESTIAKDAKFEGAIDKSLNIKNANGKKANVEKRAVMAREEPSCDRSFVMVPEELKRIYPNVKDEYIQRALEEFGKYKFGDEESTIRAFSKVLAAVIIDESIGKRGGKHGNP